MNLDRFIEDKYEIRYIYRRLTMKLDTIIED